MLNGKSHTQEDTACCFHFYEMSRKHKPRDRKIGGCLRWGMGWGVAANELELFLGVNGNIR